MELLQQRGQRWGGGVIGCTGPLRPERCSWVGIGGVKKGGCEERCDESDRGVKCVGGVGRV